MTTTFRSERRLLRGAARLAVAVALLAPPGCSRGDAPAPAPSASALDLSPVAAPPGLVGEGWVGRPEVTWKAVRELAGGPAALLPSSFALLASAFLGLPATAAGDLSTDEPLRGILVDVAGAPGWVVAFPVRSGAEAEARLTRGGDAPFQGARDEPSGVLVLSRRAATQGDVALGLVGRQLLAASSPAHLVAGGPYVARTLASSPAPAESLGFETRQPALAILAKGLRSRWGEVSARLSVADRDKREQAGRDPDFGEPATVLAAGGDAVESVAELLEGTRALRIVAAVSGERLDVNGVLDPESADAKSWVEGLTTGPLEPLLALPRSTTVALFMRSTAESRAQAAARFVGGVGTLLGARLPSADLERVRRAVEGQAKGRGDWLSAGLSLALPGGGGLVLQAPAADAALLESSLSGAHGLLGVPAISAPIERFLGKPRVEAATTQVAGVDAKVRRVRVHLQPKPERVPRGGPAPRPLETLFLVREGVLHAALGEAPAPLLSASVTGAHTLRDDPKLAPALTRLGPEGSLVAVARLGTIGLAPPTAAPAVAVVSRREGRAELRAELGRELVQVALRQSLGAQR